MLVLLPSLPTPIQVNSIYYWWRRFGRVADIDQRAAYVVSSVETRKTFTVAFKTSLEGTEP